LDLEFCCVCWRGEGLIGGGWGVSGGHQLGLVFEDLGGVFGFVVGSLGHFLALFMDIFIKLCTDSPYLFSHTIDLSFLRTLPIMVGISLIETDNNSVSFLLSGISIVVFVINFKRSIF
jgi:hypothetical protein